MLKKLITLIILYFFSSISQAYEIKLKKIISLDKPWGSSFINDVELIVTEKEGKIKERAFVTQDHPFSEVSMNR